PVVSSVQRTSTYSIYIIRDEDSALLALADAIGDRRVAIVTDETVDELYTERIARWLSNRGLKVQRMALPPGDGSKSLPAACRILDWLAQSDIRRRDVLLAVGGGMVIDTAGWVASIYMRGISYINVPTTLLAQVDAAIGGKVAVNHDTAKNLIGGFYSPDAVVSCTDWMATLDARQIRAGLAEAIKLAVIASPQLLAFIERNLESLRALDGTALRPLVHASSAIKCVLVERDPYEVDLRRTLNFGHTVGHCVETATGYGPVLHGEAVAYGMSVAVRIATARGVLAHGTAARIIGILRVLGLPTTLGELPAIPQVEEVVAALEMVRQVRNGSLRFVLPTAIGNALICDDVRDEEIRAALGDRTTAVAVGSPDRTLAVAS
ncbi:MAG: 3-dehydroquinate synthase, partial [Streptosporangiaceae bacterium]